jgi:hypothetical protein
MAGSSWPDLRLPGWEQTRDTLHLWTQVVGKVRLALEPMVNHWWQVPLYVSARGLTTSLMHADGTGLDMEFDFVDSVLLVRTTAGKVREVALEPRSVADFYSTTMAALRDVGIRVSILARPVEIAEAIPFAQDEKHHHYDPAWARRFWLALVESHRVMSRFRAGFTGKVSPVHFFWGDLRPRGFPFFGAFRTAASGRHPQLCRLGDAARLQPRGEQLRLLAWTWRRRLVLRLRVSGASRLRRLEGRTELGLL